LIYKAGLAEGTKLGKELGKDEIDCLYSWLKSQNRTDDIIRAVGNKDLQNELLEEFKNQTSN
jgi:hypothetical protein